MGEKGEGAKYKFMIVQPNGKWMQEIADLIEQVSKHGLCDSHMHLSNLGICDKLAGLRFIQAQSKQDCEASGALTALTEGRLQ